VSAIGHDGDRPLLDDVADHRCGTPSIAAALVIPSEAELRNELDYWLHRLADSAYALVDRAAQRLDAEAPSRALRAGVDRAATTLERAAVRLATASPVHRLPAASARLHGFAETLSALDPARVLDRGYAIVRTANNEVVRNSKQLKAGESVRVTVATGAFAAEVTEVEPQ
jgi:exodeoxyribonuclease VII large subunit